MKPIVALMIVGLISAFGIEPARSAPVEPHKVGTIFRDAIEVGNRVQVPLPEGDWLLIANPLRKNNTGARFYYPVLVDVKDGILQRIITIANSTEGPQLSGYSNAFVFYKECRRNDMHFTKEFTNYDNGHQDCWFLNHFTMTLGQHGGGRVYRKSKIS